MRCILAPLVAASLAGCVAETFSPPAPARVELTGGTIPEFVAPGERVGPLAFTLRDAEGSVVPGVEILVVADEGSGTVRSIRPEDDGSGTILVEWIVGPSLGTQRFQATFLGGDPTWSSTEVTGFPAARLAVGSFATCALDPDDRPWCWGDDLRFGDLDTVPDWRPVPVSGGHRFSRIAVGGSVACGLDYAGAAWCWGLDDVGQLGSGVPAPESCYGFVPCSRVPIPVVGGHQFTDIAIADRTICATTPSAAVWCWGNNAQGQAGSGTSALTVPVPTLAPTSDSVTQLAAGVSSFCALLRTGRVECWGMDAGTWAGLTNAPHARAPIELLLAETLDKLIAAPEGYCGRRSDGATWCWGKFYSIVTVPTRQPILDQFPTIGANWFGHAWALDARGSLHLAFDGTFHDVSDGTRLLNIHSGPEHGCGTGVGGRVWCWGSTASGELGNGTVYRAHDHYHYPPVPVGGWHPLP